MFLQLIGGALLIAMSFVTDYSALAWLMFVIVLGISIVMFRTSARWVFYAGGER